MQLIRFTTHMLAAAALSIPAASAASAAPAAPAAPAARAAYPDKPIRIVVTFAAGGASEIFARVTCEPPGKALGTTVIVDNKPGAGGTLGGQDVVRAAPDGRALMLSNSTPLSIAPFAVPRQPYDPIKQSTHVALLGVAPVPIMADPKSGPATLEDLPEAAAADPACGFGSGGPGSIGPVVGGTTNSAMKVHMTHIPCTGGAPMTTALIAGTSPLGIDVIAACVPMMKSGRIKGLAVTSKARWPLAPDVPTVVEPGLPTLVAEIYFGVSGPAGLPRQVSDKLHAALDKVMPGPATIKRFEELGITPAKASPAGFADGVAQQANAWAPIVRAPT